MSYNFLDAGSITVQPSSGFPSGSPFVNIPLNDAYVLSAVQTDVVTLSDNTPKAVSFGDLAGANVVFIYANGAKVTATITSADGAAQVIPVDPKLDLASMKVPITAITLTRDPLSSTVTTVQVLLGLKA